MVRRAVRSASRAGLLGAVTTVLVAWGCWAWVEFDGTGVDQLPALGFGTMSGETAGGERVLRWRERRSGATQWHVVRFEERTGIARLDLLPGWLWRRIDAEGLLQPGRGEWRRVEAQGWPLAALWSERVALVGRTMGEDGSGLPVRVAWGGFAADTALYGGVWFALLAGPPALVRAVRVRRGRCRECGYELGGAGGCPECGWGRETA